MNQRYLFFILFISLFNTLYSQPRVDNDKVIRIEKTSLTTNAVIGWCYNKEYRKWFSYHYVICAHKVSDTL